MPVVVAPSGLPINKRRCKYLPFGKRFHVYFVCRPIGESKTWVNHITNKLQREGYIVIWLL